MNSHEKINIDYIKPVEELDWMALSRSEKRYLAYKNRDIQRAFQKAATNWAMSSLPNPYFNSIVRT